MIKLRSLPLVPCPPVYIAQCPPPPRRRPGARRGARRPHPQPHRRIPAGHAQGQHASLRQRQERPGPGQPQPSHDRPDPGLEPRSGAAGRLRRLRGQRIRPELAQLPPVAHARPDRRAVRPLPDRHPHHHQLAHRPRVHGLAGHPRPHVHPLQRHGRAGPEHLPHRDSQPRPSRASAHRQHERPADPRRPRAGRRRRQGAAQLLPAARAPHGTDGPARREHRQMGATGPVGAASSTNRRFRKASLEHPAPAGKPSPWRIR